MADLIKTEWTDRPEGGRVARVIINDPRRLNAMSSEMMRQFVNAMDAVSLEDECRCVIVEGAGGRAFVGGANVFELVALKNQPHALYSPKSTAAAMRCANALSLLLQRSMDSASALAWN